MSQQTIVITGASDGIGAAAARELVTKGHEVVLVGRSPAKTAAIADELGAPYHLADFADLEQVRRLSAELDAAYPSIHALANNAGGVMGQREITKDGFEKTFQVNHLGAFLLTNLLMPKLVASRAKVIQTSSLAAKRFSLMNIDDLQNEFSYSPLKAYGDGKLANILFTRELQRRYGPQGVAAAAFHPGIVATSFASNSDIWMRLAYHTPLISRVVMTSPKKGAAPLIWLLTGIPGVTWQPGEYYEKNKVSSSSPQAGDAVLASELWDRSAEMVGL